MRKRTNIIWIGILVLLLVLGARLFFIQVIQGDSLKKETLVQQLIPVVGLDNRGQIYDRNMVPLTGKTMKYYYVIAKTRVNEDFQILTKFNDAKKVGGNRKYDIYQFDQFDSALNKKLVEDYSAYSFQYPGRNSSKQLCVHLVGTINQWNMTGSSGIEKMCENQLNGKSKQQSLIGDGAGNILMGRGVNLSDKAAENVVTTIDSSLQGKVEEILSKLSKPASAVVLDTNSGDVLAMAATPTFNPSNLEDYLDDEGNELINKSIQGEYPPGSIFKIIVAAAALKDESVNSQEQYTCTGETTVNGITLKCSEAPEGGHGNVDMKSAFAKSCNCYFANLADKIGSEKIIEMAKHFGLGQATETGLQEESKGNLPEKSERVYSGLSNLAIGQGSLLVTPVQMAKATNIIACGGVNHGVHVIKDSEIKKERVMEESVAKEVSGMMGEVLKSGTASAATIDVTACGKTGSAESSINGKEITHGWFTGFFPASNPKYTVTVFVEDGKTGSGSALPVFEEIVNYIY